MTGLDIALAFGIGLAVGRWLALRTALRHARRRIRDQVRPAERRAEDAESRLRHIEAILEAFGTAQSDSLLQLDADRRVAWANPAAIERFNLDLERSSSLLSITGSAILDDVLDAVTAGQPLEEMVSIADRRYRVGLARAESHELVLALRDETDNERLTRARRELVANVSHDLRTPLTAIGLLAERLEIPDLAPHERVDVVLKIREQLDALRRLAEGLVELSRLESGRLPLRLSPVAVQDLASAALASMQPILDRSRVDVELGDGMGLSVLVDASQIVRVLDNLLANAVHASRPGDTIRIEAEPTDVPEFVALHVVDEGTGIPPQDLDRIFERFYRADRSRSLRGTGLGLAIVKHVVEHHGGTVLARNNPRQGATISMTLPAVD